MSHIFQPHYSLRQLSLILIMVGFSFGVYVKPAQALTVSPSPLPTVSPKAATKTLVSPSPSDDETITPISSDSAETTQKLKDRIEKIVEERKSQIMGAITDLKQDRRGFIGEVQRISAETITLKTAKGTQILPITNVALTKKGKGITVDNVAVGDWAMVIGETKNDTFQPQLIDVSSVSLRPKNHLVAFGTVTDITKTTLTFKARNQNDETKLTITKSSVYQDADQNPLVFKTLTKQTEVLLIGEETDTGWEVALVKLVGPKN